MAKFWIKYSSTGNSDNMEWEAISAKDYDDASYQAWQAAYDDYSQYEGLHGIGPDEEELEGLDEEEAENVRLQHSESWVDYQVTAGVTYEVEYTNGNKQFEQFPDIATAQYALQHDHVYDYKKVE